MQYMDRIYVCTYTHRQNEHVSVGFAHSCPITAVTIFNMCALCLHVCIHSIIPELRYYLAQLADLGSLLVEK